MKIRFVIAKMTAPKQSNNANVDFLSFVGLNRLQSIYSEYTRQLSNWMLIKQCKRFGRFTLR
jgi:hypothetical protein